MANFQVRRFVPFFSDKNAGCNTNWGLLQMLLCETIYKSVIVVLIPTVYIQCLRVE